MRHVGDAADVEEPLGRFEVVGVARGVGELHQCELNLFVAVGLVLRLAMVVVGVASKKTRSTWRAFFSATSSRVQLAGGESDGGLYMADDVEFVAVIDIGVTAVAHHVDRLPGVEGAGGVEVAVLLGGGDGGDDLVHLLLEGRVLGGLAGTRRLP